MHHVIILEYYNAIESRKARVPCDTIGMGTIGVGVIGKLDSASL